MFQVPGIRTHDKELSALGIKQSRRGKLGGTGNGGQEPVREEECPMETIKEEVETVRNISNGMFISGEINGQGAKLLVDTGASICLVNPSVYFAIPVQKRPKTDFQVKKKVVTEDGKNMKIFGIANF